MADAYLKPQSPILYKNDYIYPLTTYDQIILADGSRWDGIIIPASRKINGHALTNDVTLEANDISALSLNGGIVNGSIMADRFIVSSKNGESCIAYANSTGTEVNRIFSDNTTRQLHIGSRASDTLFLESYRFPSAASGLTSNITYDVLTTKIAVTIAQGGTGANTAEQALANLGAFSNKGGTITGDVTATGTITATKVIGAVYA